ncbi:MAG: DUF2892 domain-containing protein [Nitrospinaceae bacterium]|nr:DUF2892 domain-containing protein [Nitrospinaceae bacterium]NIR56849.1 DUF2892 domain-containing protein [Nitrospinaceae bacterium]NIS87316.1 DUF2892 domain-containing protein [Nitrospinaceae bacterium]NIT84169.1 DUF2892 domain-containing protein [Nitrospinaceae bacterium]NIU46356.1 DUF2892 domain-containing protein [Nitrospinaceae bacterium]
MCKNVGTLDRLIRIMFGTGMIFQGVIMGHAAGCVLAIAGLVPLISGLSSKCPIYKAININTID